MKIISNYIYNIFLFLFSLLLILILCETILRIKNFLVPNYDIEMWRYSKILKEKSDNPKIGHVHIKNKSAILQKVNVKINNFGQRGEDINLEKLYDFDRRILVLGSSITLGWGVEQDKILTNVIKKKSIIDNHNWLVINGGIGNYNTERYINNYFENWEKLEPTDIVIQFFVNDTEELTDNKANFFTKHTHLGVMIWKFLNSLRIDYKLDNIENYYKQLFDDSNNGFITAVSELKNFKNHCLKKNINCAIVLTPDIHKLNPYKLEFINKKMKLVANNLDIKIYDLLNEFKIVDETDLWNNYNDPHPNELGHSIMGNKIYNLLNK